VRTWRSLFRRYLSILAQDADCDDAIIGHVGRFHGGDAEDVLRKDVRSDLGTESLHVRCPMSGRGANATSIDVRCPAAPEA
jgi:hypothetical protein